MLSLCMYSFGAAIQRLKIPAKPANSAVQTQLQASGVLANLVAQTEIALGG